MKRLSFLLLAMFTLTACASPRPTASPRSADSPRSVASSLRSMPANQINLLPLADLNSARHVQFILASQRPSGAFAMTPETTADVNPYFANLAAMALLAESGVGESGVAESRGAESSHLQPVRRYMEWYLSRLNPDGTIFDYRVEHGLEVSTGNADSTDSYAATFLSLVAKWGDAGGDPAWTLRHRSSLDKVAGAILAVTDQDGLTWAKPGYRHKLLMDNCEVYQGWLSWSKILADQGDTLGAAEARNRAEQIADALPRFRQPDGAWGWAISRSGRLRSSNLEKFYPDAVAQVFPLIWGLQQKPVGYQSLDANQPAWRRLEVDHFPWLLPAYAAALAGDRAAVEQTLTYAESEHPDLNWPWFIAESAWVIQALAETR